MKKPKETTINSKNKKIGPNEFFQMIMRNVSAMLGDYVNPLKREIEDMKNSIFQIKRDLNSIKLDYKALGFTMAELGVVELNTLNKTKSMIYDKLAVVNSNGIIKGRTTITRYNMVKSGET